MMKRQVLFSLRNKKSPHFNGLSVEVPSGFEPLYPVLQTGA